MKIAGYLLLYAAAMQYGGPEGIEGYGVKVGPPVSQVLIQASHLFQATSLFNQELVTHHVQQNPGSEVSFILIGPAIEI